MVSRFQWLPDGTLLVSVGDGGNPPTTYNGELIREQAQLLNAHLGKIIRINDDGSVPDNNPFIGRPDVLPEIYSYGHRNVQGITYDPEQERVIASEHGSKGGDEVNSVTPGANYGWPLATYSTEYDGAGTLISPDISIEGAVDPLVAWTPTIAPSEIVYYTGTQYPEWEGDVFLAGMLLRENNSIAAYASSPAGAVLRMEAAENGGLTPVERIVVGEVRVRSIEQGPDGALYVLTDSTGRQNRPGAQNGALVRIE
jgi:glucose/arabinose dehydrogenase